MIYNPALATQQYAQRKIVEELFTVFLEAATSREPQRLNIFPLAFRDDVLEAEREPEAEKRIVADMIASMADHELVKLYQRIKGVSLGSVLDYL